MLPSTSFGDRFQLTNKAEFLKTVYAKEDQLMNASRDRPPPARTFQFRSYLGKDGLPAVEVPRPQTSASTPNLGRSLRAIPARATHSFLSSAEYGSFYPPEAAKSFEPTFPPEPMQLVEMRCRQLRERKKQLRRDLRKVKRRMDSRQGRRRGLEESKRLEREAEAARRAEEDEAARQKALADSHFEQREREKRAQRGYLEGICARCGHAQRDHGTHGGRHLQGRFKPRGKRRVVAHPDNLAFVEPGETPPFMRRPDTTASNGRPVDSWGARVTVCDQYEPGSLGSVNHTGGTPRAANRPPPTFTLACDMAHTKAYPIFWPTDPLAAAPRDFKAAKAKLLASKQQSR